MPNSLLPTKLYIPSARVSLVPRPLLIQKLNAGLGEEPTVFPRKLSLISAPAGFGKTTLVTEWIGLQKRPVAWLALDEDDSEPQQFFNYLALAVSKVDEGGQSLSGLLQSPQAIPAKSMMTAFINDVTSVSSPFLLILDDYHLIQSAEIDQAMTFLLDHMPLQMHLVLSSRRDPGFPLARLRAQRQMTEIRADDLRFTAPETSDFLQQVMGLALDSAQITALEERTEGWVAGLQMAALSMQNRADVAGFIAAFTGDDRYIVDYLVDEVLAQQSEKTQSFLLQTSILERLTGPLCDALTGRGDGRDVLERLEQANLFVIPLDNRREWYRYHHLFADMLQHRLRRIGPAQISTLHQRASAWYDGQGDVGEAFRHALAAGDLERAADMIVPVSLTMIAESRLSMLLSWLAKLPQELIAVRPWLCVTGAWANLLTGQMRNVEPLLRSAEAALSEIAATTLADRDQIVGHLTVIRAYVARWQDGDMVRSIELSQEAINYVSENNLLARSALFLNLANTYLECGKLHAAASAAEQARLVARKGNMHYVVLAASACLGQVQMRKGDLHQADHTYRQTIQLGTEWGGGQPLPATGYAHVGLSQVLYEWNELDEALLHLARGIEMGTQVNEISTVLDGTLALVPLQQALGEISAASEDLERVQEILSKSTRAQVSSPLSAQQAQLWLAQDDLAAAASWAAAQEALLADEVRYARMPEYLALVRVLIALDREQPGGVHLFGASNLLVRLLAKAEAAEWTASVMEILVLQAVVFQAQSEIDYAILTLERALVMGEPEGYTRLYVDEGEPMASLLRRLTNHPYATQLLTMFPGGGTDSPIPHHALSLVEPLSERELEVLHLMAHGLKYQEIADQLIVSLNTVRSHMKNIYGKLGVNNRTQAIAKASELKLL